MSNSNQNGDFLGMSDDDFLKMSPSAAASVEEEEETNQAEQTEQEETPAAAVLEDQTEESPNQETEAQNPEQPSGETEPEGEKTTPDTVENPGSETELKNDDQPKEEEEKPSETPVDYEAFYKQVMQPIKANGKMLEIRSPEEVIRLMQMGAGYGRKIQDLQPYLKTIRMLEKNDLLTEDKLSYLIDLHHKNPDAIKKLVKEAGIDPLDLNVDENVSYTPTNHSVSDAEVAFYQALDEVQSRPNGEETLRIINQTWDQESKAALGNQPQLLSVIQSQRENGIYDRIAAEIDRQKTLGYIPLHTPFLEAYTRVGNMLQQAGAFGVQPQVTPVQSQPGIQPQQPQVIATRPAAPKSQVQNNNQVKAAAPPKTVPSAKATTTVNPLSMPDDEFLKTFAGRL